MESTRMPDGLLHGEFWSRQYDSDSDVVAELADPHINTPFKTAFVDACMAVEDSDAGDEPDSLARVEIRASPVGFRIEATNPRKPGRMYVLIVQRCAKCGAPTHESRHPFNGCPSVVIEEVMTS